MDPQKLAQLDPKLRDAYQRVMGTPIPQVQPASPRGEPVQAQTPPMPAPPMPDPTSVPQPQPEPPMPPPAGGPTPTIQEPPAIPTPQPPTPELAIPEPQPAIPQQPPVSAGNFVQMHSEVASNQSSPNFSTPAPQSQGQTMVIKKKNGMMPILIGAAGLVFLVVYTLFWTKLFNFKLPFLP